jgi:hypothetical protein
MSPENQKQDNGNQPSSPLLIPGEDYYLEKGRYVFTAQFHLKRGHCCESGCRHCPYKNKK